MSSDLKDIALDEELENKLLQFTKSLDGWMPKEIKGLKVDYYQYLTYKIENGKVFIRDPWPVEGIGKGNGVEAIISEDEFALFWAQGGNYMFKVK